MPSHPSSPLSPPAWLAILLCCTAAPLLAYNLTPSATLFNQLLALAGGGGVLICLSLDKDRLRWRGGPAGWAMAMLLVAPWASWLWTGLPLALTLSATALTGTALLLLLAGQGLSENARRAWFEALCWALLAAGTLSLIVSLIQVFLPSVPDGKLIAKSGIVGRAVGNMRQPNHLASLLMWSCVAAVYLADRGRLRKTLPVWLLAFVFGVVLSASRTGMLGVVILAVWGALDRKLSRATRFALLATPLMLAVSWWGLSVWASSGDGHAFGAESRLAEGAGSPTRLAILANAWALVKQNPWLGVGWGEFNLAWTMSVFPQRPIAFFDHTHNLPMQLAVELGLPLALLICGLLCWALWRAFRASMKAAGEAAVVGRCATLLVVMIGLHSLLEYPLWYAYFLLPAAFAFGLALAGSPASERSGMSATSWPLAAAGAVIIVGSSYTFFDYLKVVSIYVPAADAEPLAERIATGQRSLFFAPLADYAAATSPAPSAATLAAAQGTGHNLIDARLLVAWAQSLHATGDDDRARYVVQRLREFRHPLGEELLAVCAGKEAMPPASQPFQCSPPTRSYEWREMR